jgi:hypothetical protein
MNLGNEWRKWMYDQHTLAANKAKGKRFAPNPAFHPLN